MSKFKFSREELLRIAKSQKAIITLILVNLLFAIGSALSLVCSVARSMIIAQTTTAAESTASPIKRLCAPPRKSSGSALPTESLAQMKPWQIEFYSYGNRTLSTRPRANQ